MDKKYIERPKKFDRQEYVKQHYKQFKADIKPELKERIDKICQEENISKPEFLRRAVELMEKNNC